jgi:hypothetical protein
MRICEIAQARVRYGCRKIRMRLNREGWEVGKHLVYRLYKEEGLMLKRMRPPLAARWIAFRSPLPAEPKLLDVNSGSMKWSMTRFPNSLPFQIFYSLTNKNNYRLLALDADLSHRRDTSLP